MASRHRSVRVVVFALLLSACTGGLTTPTAPTAPPDLFAPTPSIGELAPPTTARNALNATPDMERMVIYPVEPRTLTALPGFEPIPMGDWMWGQPSPNGGYFAANVGNESGGDNEIRLIDVAAWRLAGSWPRTPESALLVSDDGTVHFFGAARLHQVRPGDPAPEAVASLPRGLSSWGIGSVFEGSVFSLGSLRGMNQAEHASIVSIEVTTGETVLIDLPSVGIGPLEPLGDQPWSDLLLEFPSVVWDHPRSRALVVHGDSNVVSEVDLDSGAITEHGFEGAAAGSDRAAFQRTAALSPDGRYLYVSSQAARLVDDDPETWRVTMESTGVVVIDTTTWEVGPRLLEPVGVIFLSPDGRRLIGWGYTLEQTSTEHLPDLSGLFVLDTVDLEILAHHPSQSTEQWPGPISFSRDSAVGYATSWTTSAQVSIIELDSGEVIGRFEGEQSLEMIGPIGALGISLVP